MVYLEPDIDSGIASVSPICGCTGGCVYCYIDIKEYNVPQLNDITCNQIIKYLLNDNRFVPGSEGTFVCIGTWGELFPTNKLLKRESFKWIKELAKLDNPIVIITKKALTDDEIEEIESFQKYENQISFLISITSLSKWKVLEPGTSPALARLDMGARIRTKKMNVAVFVNPFLKTITDLELDTILQKCEEKKIQNVIVSPLYLNSKIINKKCNCPDFANIVEAFYENDFTNSNHMKNEEYEVIEDSIDDFVDGIMINCKARNLRCWLHYSCFLSNIYKRSNDSQKNKKFCVHCGNCF